MTSKRKRTKEPTSRQRLALARGRLVAAIFDAGLEAGASDLVERLDQWLTARDEAHLDAAARQQEREYSDALDACGDTYGSGD